MVPSQIDKMPTLSRGWQNPIAPTSRNADLLICGCVLPAQINQVST
jgi:hypothetical protein